MSRIALASAAIVTALLSVLPVWAKPLKPVRAIRATADFEGKKPGKAALDISGMACLPPLGGKRRCLLVNDENRSAQFAMLAGDEISPAESVPLIGDAPSPTTLGRAPVLCAKQGRFGEFDGEGVAYAAPYLYVIGSHGCARGESEFRLSSFQLARIPVNGAGEAAGPTELTYRLSDLLQRAGEAAPFFGKNLQDENGLNIEGVAVVGDRLWAGLRAPVIKGRAFLVGASLGDLFAPGSEPARLPPLVVAFPAGGKRGVRDLAALADGRLLVLLGPAQDQDVSYALILLDPARPDAARELGALRKRKNAKAEALAILDESPDSLSVLIAYDSVENGEIEEYRLSLK